jgi:diadenylate cyclase
MSEQSDAVVLIVSEETGAISIAFDARLYYDLSGIEVSRKLRELLDRGSRSSVLGALGGGVSSGDDDSLEKDVLVEQ